MSDLRETLARRFHKAVESGPFGHGNPWESETGIGHSTYLRAADECIRQMEWARFRYQGDHSIPGQPGHALPPEQCPQCIAYRLPLTAAPNGWEVPK